MSDDNRTTTLRKQDYRKKKLDIMQYRNTAHRKRGVRTTMLYCGAYTRQ